MKKKRQLNLNSFPSTRKALYFDILKKRWRGLFLLSFYFFLGMIPSLVSLICRRIFLPLEGDAYSLFAFNTFYFILFSFGLLFLSIPLGGVLKILKHYSFGEPVFYKDDFLEGTKDSFLDLFLSILLFSLILLGSIEICLNPSLHIFLKGLFVGVLCFVLFPILLIVINEISIYSNKLRYYIKNAIYLYIKNFFKILLVSILNLLPLFFFLIGNVVIMTTCLILFYLATNPFLLLFDVIYFNYIFDKSINKDHYKEIYRKGLFDPNFKE